MSCSERLRILHLMPGFGVGGAEQMACHLMVAQSESNDITGVSLHPPTGSSIESRLTAARIPLRFLRKRPGFDPRLFSALDRVFDEVQPHVVHTHLSVLRYALPGLVRRHVPVAVHTLHNMAEYENDRIGRIIQWFAFRRAVVPVAISSEVAASCKRVYGLECRAVVPNCIPVDRYRGSSSERMHWRRKQRLDQNAVVFTCVGRLEPQKNPLMLIRAFAALTDGRAHLVMLGEGSLRDQVADYVRELRLERRVHLLGKREDIREYLAASDAFVLSSNWEGNPLAVMEAMAAGLPVVATAVGGIPELVQPGEQGFLVPPGDATAFANAMQRLLDEPEQRGAMAIAARCHAVRAFNVDRMADGYANVYRQLLERQVAHP